MFTNSAASFVTLVTGITIIGAFSFTVSFVIGMILKANIGIRVSGNDEHEGLDSLELGMASYPGLVMSFEIDERKGSSQLSYGWLFLIVFIFAIDYRAERAKIYEKYRCWFGRKWLKKTQRHRNLLRVK